MPPPEAAVKAKPALVGTEWVGDSVALLDTLRARIGRQDTIGLVRLLVSESTFARDIYPQSPAYDSSRPDVFQFIYGMQKANSVKGLKRLLSDGTALPDSLRTAENEFKLSAPVKKDRPHPAPDNAGIVRTYEVAGHAMLLAGAVLKTEKGWQVASYAGAGRIDLKNGNRDQD